MVGWTAKMGGWPALMASCVSLALSGCAGVHLYDAQRAGYADTAKTAYGKVDFKNFMEVRRTNLAALQARDEELADKRAKLMRDGTIIAVFRSKDPWATLDTSMGISDTSLGVDSTGQAPAASCENSWVAPNGSLDANCILRQENAWKQHEADLQASTDGFRLEWKMEPPVCDANISKLPDWTDASPPAGLPDRYAAVVKDLQTPFLTAKQLTYGDYKAKCARANKDFDTFKDRLLAVGPSYAGDTLPDLVDRLSKARKAYNDDLAQAQAAADAVQRAADGLKTASQPGAGATLSAEAAKAENDLASAMRSLEDAGKATGIGQSAATQKKLAAIDAFLAAISDSSTGGSTSSSVALTPDLAEAAGILKTIPSLADQIAAVGTTLSTPGLSALEIEKARQTALAAQATRTVSRTQQRVGILQEAFDDRLEELARLKDARNERALALAPQPAKRGRNPAPDSSADAYNLEALNEYQISAYLGAKATARLKADEIDLDEQAAADTAEFAIDSYQAVLTTPINQFSAFEQAGIKPADLAQTLSQIATAVGVNIFAGK